MPELDQTRLAKSAKERILESDRVRVLLYFQLAPLRRSFPASLRRSVTARPTLCHHDGAHDGPKHRHVLHIRGQRYLIDRIRKLRDEDYESSAPSWPPGQRIA
jgi:hypothetical protein